MSCPGGPRAPIARTDSRSTRMDVGNSRGGWEQWAFLPGPPRPEDSDRRWRRRADCPGAVWAAVMTRVSLAAQIIEGARHPRHQRLQSPLRGTGRRDRGGDVPASGGGHQPWRDLQPSRGDRSAGENDPPHHGGGHRAHLVDPSLRDELPGARPVPRRQGPPLRDRSEGGSTGYRAGRRSAPGSESRPTRSRAVRRPTGSRHGTSRSARWAPGAAGSHPSARVVVAGASGELRGAVAGAEARWPGRVILAVDVPEDDLPSSTPPRQWWSLRL